MSDESFREVADMLFGAGGDEIIAKFNPDGADLHVKTAAEKDKKKRQITAGLSAVGAAAGGAGLALGGHNLMRSYKTARYGMKGKEAARKVAGATKPIRTKKAAMKEAVGNEKLATGLIPLEVAGLTGEVAATTILHGDTKKKKGVAKRYIPDHEDVLYPRRALTRGAAKQADKAAGHAKGKLKELPAKKKGWFGKNVDVKWEGTFSKVNADKQQVFGWASIVEMNGEPVVDLQGDYIAIDEVEKAAYTYVHKSRKGGDMHLREGDAPVAMSDMIESFVVTPEKKAAMHLPDETPTGWWVGYQVNDPDLWSKVKSGERTGFSIHGRGMRSPR